MTFQSVEPTSQANENTPNIEAYEAPAIESILTPEALEREVHYAGNVAVISGAPTP